MTYIHDKNMADNTLNIHNDGSITVRDSGIAIASGGVTGMSSVHKFGNAPDFDTGDGDVDVWDGANDAAPDLMSYTFLAAASTLYISSDDAGDGQVYEVQGLDANYALQITNVTASGLTFVPIAGTWLRVFRVKNLGATSNAGNIYISDSNVDTSGGADGIPDTLTAIKAMIQIGNNQTLMAIYTVPAGKTAYMDSFWAGTAGASKASEYDVSVHARSLGGVFQLKHLSALQDSGTSHWLHPNNVPEKFAAKTDIVMRANLITAAKTGASISAGFELILVDN